jgi:hypothetical protein
VVVVVVVAAAADNDEPGGGETLPRIPPEALALKPHRLLHDDCHTSCVYRFRSMA